MNRNSFPKLMFWICSLALISGCFFTPPNLKNWYCVADEDCLGELKCHEKRCTTSCTNERDCVAEEVCREGYCFSTKKDAGPPPGCQVKKEDCNGKDDDCDGQIDNGIWCADKGQVCDLNANPPILCKQGLKCVGFYPDRPRTCLEPCTGSNAACPDSRFKCRRSPTGPFVCLQSGCNQQNGTSDCLYPRHECISLSKDNLYCLPYHQTGTLAFPKACSPSNQRMETTLRFCNKSHRCLRKSFHSQGLCSIRCQADSDCKTITSDPQVACRPFQGNTKLCVKLCPNGDTDCPNFTICNVNTKQCDVQK